MENQVNTPISIKKTSGSMIWKQKCRYCEKEHSFKERKDYVDFSGYCNDECRKKYIESERIKLIKDVIRWTIPKKFIDIETDRLDFLERYYGKNLFITGSAGTGKTVFACSILKNRAKEKSRFKEYEYDYVGKASIKFISYPKFIMELQSAFRDQDKDPNDMANKVANYPGYLCIDDLGAEKLTDFVKQITYFIINEREQNMLPIIITSNFSLEQIDSMIDPRISSRISGMCEILRFKGKDRRIK